MFFQFMSLAAHLQFQETSSKLSIGRTCRLSSADTYAVEWIASRSVSTQSASSVAWIHSQRSSNWQPVPHQEKLSVFLWLLFPCVDLCPGWWPWAHGHHLEANDKQNIFEHGTKKSNLKLISPTDVDLSKILGDKRKYWGGNGGDNWWKHRRFSIIEGAHARAPSPKVYANAPPSHSIGVTTDWEA